MNTHDNAGTGKVVIEKDWLESVQNDIAYLWEHSGPQTRWSGSFSQTDRKFFAGMIWREILDNVGGERECHFLLMHALEMNLEASWRTTPDATTSSIDGNQQIVVRSVVSLNTV